MTFLLLSSADDSDSVAGFFFVNALLQVILRGGDMARTQRKALIPFPAQLSHSDFVQTQKWFIRFFCSPQVNTHKTQCLQQVDQWRQCFLLNSVA